MDLLTIPWKEFNLTVRLVINYWLRILLLFVWGIGRSIKNLVLSKENRQNCQMWFFFKVDQFIFKMISINSSKILIWECAMGRWSSKKKVLYRSHFVPNFLCIAVLPSERRTIKNTLFSSQCDMRKKISNILFYYIITLLIIIKQNLSSVWQRIIIRKRNL